MTAPFIRTRNTWLAYLLLAMYAYFLNIFGPITPFLHDELNLSYTVSSFHFSAFAAGILVVGLFGHALIHRLGPTHALATGALGIGVGALGLAASRLPLLTIGASFLMGCVGSLILAVVPAILAQEHPAWHAVAISEANVLSSVISACAPLLVGWLASSFFGWRWALVLGVLVVVSLGAVLLRQPPGHTEASETQSHSRLPLRFWYYWFVLALAVAVEFCMVFWSADYMQSVQRLVRAQAAQTVSLFLAGMIAGRLICSRFVQRLGARRLVFISSGIGLLGFTLFWLAMNPWLGMIGLALTGLGVGGLYPLLLSTAISAAPGQESQAGARTTLASGVAILLLPLALGRLADGLGLRPAFLLVGLLLVSVLALMLAKRK